MAGGAVPQGADSTRANIPGPMIATRRVAPSPVFDVPILTSMDPASTTRPIHGMERQRRRRSPASVRYRAPWPVQQGR